MTLLKKLNYKSMSFEQLLSVKLPIDVLHNKKIHCEHLAFIANELRIKGYCKLQS